jgi:hypothetical protein
MCENDLWVHTEELADPNKSEKDENPKKSKENVNKWTKSEIEMIESTTKIDSAGHNNL